MKRPRRRLSEIVYQVGAVWLGGWRDIEIEPLARAGGFASIHSQTVVQLGIPSEVLVAQKPSSS